jgi:hypothetical protein
MDHVCLLSKVTERYLVDSCFRKNAALGPTQWVPGNFIGNKRGLSEDLGVQFHLFITFHRCTLLPCPL